MKNKVTYFLVAVVMFFCITLTVSAEPVPSNAVASNIVGIARGLNKIPVESFLQRYGQIRSCIDTLYSNKKNITQSDVQLVESELLKNVTQSELNDLLNWNVHCMIEYAYGIHCPKSLGMNKFYKMYDEALKLSGRKTAYDIFKRTDGELSLDGLYLLHDGYRVVERNITTMHDAVCYMNEELYFNVDQLALVISRELILMKRKQLIDNGYAVVFRVKNNQRVYSDGAEILLHYCDRLVNAFNGPYFLGLNAALEEVGCTERFNNPRIMCQTEAEELARKVIYCEANINNRETKWMLRITHGICGFNEIVDRINNGNEKLRQLSKSKK